MKIKLVRLTNEYKTQLFDMMNEWMKSNEKIFPTSIAVNDYHDFDYYMNHLCRDRVVNGIVPETTFFCLDCDRNILSVRLLLDII